MSGNDKIMPSRKGFTRTNYIQNKHPLRDSLERILTKSK